MRAILERAWPSPASAMLDTAAGLRRHRSSDWKPLMASCRSRSSSKIPPLPAGADDAGSAGWTRSVLGGPMTTREPGCTRCCFIGPRTYSKRHGASGLADEPVGDATTGTPAGVSCYDARRPFALRGRMALEVAQLPGNAFDQRRAPSGRRTGRRRDPPALRLPAGPAPDAAGRAAARVPAARGRYSAWHEWRASADWTRSSGGARSRKVAASESATAWWESTAMRNSRRSSRRGRAPVPQEAAFLAIDDADVIDPRHWARKQ